MKKPIAAICNDWHLKVGNEDEVIRSIDHLISYCVANGIDQVIIAGDIFDVRKVQALSVLLAFDRIISMFREHDISVRVIPGNHDKPVYSEASSYIDLYSDYIHYYPDTTLIKLSDVRIVMMPFFSDQIQLEMLKEAPEADVLIGHFELNGSTHLGNVASGRAISASDLKKWKKVYLGHYHNHHEVTKNIVHLPSLRQNNFGEDERKGFSILYDDLSYEIVIGDFQKLRTISVDVDTATQKDLVELIQEHRESSDKIRFELIGSSAKIKAIDRSMIMDAGINVIARDRSFEVDRDRVDKVAMIVTKYDRKAIDKVFLAFCEQNNLDHKQGIEYLNKFLNTNKNEER